MFKKVSEFVGLAKKKVTAKIIDIQSEMICNKEKYDSRAGRRFLAGCVALTGAMGGAFAQSGATDGAFAQSGGSGSADAIANAIKTSVAGAYGAMKTVGVVVAAVGVCLSAFFLFTGGDKGMEKAKKTLLYTVIGCGILFLAVPIVNFMSGLFSGQSSGFDALTTS